MSDYIYTSLIDLEIDVACLLDSREVFSAQDIKTIKDKISSLRANLAETLFVDDYTIEDEHDY